MRSLTNLLSTFAVCLASAMAAVMFSGCKRTAEPEARDDGRCRAVLEKYANLVVREGLVAEPGTDAGTTLSLDSKIEVEKQRIVNDGLASAEWGHCRKELTPEGYACAMRQTTAIGIEDCLK